LRGKITAVCNFCRQLSRRDWEKSYGGFGASDIPRIRGVTAVFPTSTVPELGPFLGPMAVLEVQKGLFSPERRF